MATVRMAGAAALGALTETANAATSIIMAGATGAKMLNAWADDAAWKQAQSLKVGRVGYQEQLIAHKTIEIDQSRDQLQQYIGDNSDRKTRCDAIEAALKEALA